MKRLNPVLAAVCFAVVLATASTARERLQAQTERSLEGIDPFIESVMKEWKVPGLAVAVIQDDQVVLSRGYGHRDVERSLPVTSSTLFAIGSITKSFTVTALGMLVDEGKLDWDKPLRAYLPDFALQDRVATEQMTPRDLVVHRSGLPRHDILWYGSGFTREQMYQRLRHLQPSKEFRSTYQYQNLMFMTAGYLAGKIAGSSWESLVREKVLKPLGMNGSNFSVVDSQKTEDFSFPYSEVKKEVRKIPFRNIDEVGPAGSINSNVEEMIRYVQFHINHGKQGDKQLLSRTNSDQMQSPQMVMPGDSEYEELGLSSYGMGMVVTSYRGHRVVTHGGGIDGFVSLLSFMPRKKIGMIILTNLSGNNPVPSLISRNLYDRLLGLETIDWVERIKAQEEKAKTAREEAEKKREVTRKEGTSPSHALADYGGNYEHAGYGVVRIAADGNDLRLHFNSFEIAMKHFHYDIFEIPRDLEGVAAAVGGAKVSFYYNQQGDIDRLTLPLEPSVDPILFTRVADEAMKKREFLTQFAGDYGFGPVIAKVEMRAEDTLTLTVPGQPTYTLVPVRGTTFDLQGIKGYSVEFRKGSDGRVSEAVFHQPNGTFPAKRK